MYGFIQSPEAFVSEKQIEVLIDKHINDHKWSNVLLLLPDVTCSRAGVGCVTARYYEKLTARGCVVKIMSADGIVRTMSEEELREIFGTAIPRDAYLDNCYGKFVGAVRDIPVGIVNESTREECEAALEVVVSRELFSGKYDAILCVGQVNLDKIAGMEDFTGRLLVGGDEFIVVGNFVSAFGGQQSSESQGKVPIGQLARYVYENILDILPITFVLTGVQYQNGKEICKGIFVGKAGETFEAAAILSQRDRTLRLKANENGQA